MTPSVVEVTIHVTVGAGELHGGARRVSRNGGGLGKPGTGRRRAWVRGAGVHRGKRGAGRPGRQRRTGELRRHSRSELYHPRLARYRLVIAPDDAGGGPSSPSPLRFLRSSSMRLSSTRSTSVTRPDRTTGYSTPITRVLDRVRTRVPEPSSAALPVSFLLLTTLPRRCCRR